MKREEQAVSESNLCFQYFCTHAPDVLEALSLLTSNFIRETKHDGGRCPLSHAFLCISAAIFQSQPIGCHHEDRMRVLEILYKRAGSSCIVTGISQST
jgi:hypothetical protein